MSVVSAPGGGGGRAGRYHPLHSDNRVARLPGIPGPSSRHHQQQQHHGGGSNRYAHSELGGGGGSSASPFLVPRFSALTSEGGPKMRSAAADDWENSTAVTSHHSFAFTTMRDERSSETSSPPPSRPIVRRCSRLLWLLFATFLTLLALLSAPAMIAAPAVASRLLDIDWTVSDCRVHCQGVMLQVFVKTVLLVAALWAMYWRRSVVDLPRLFFARAMVAVFVCFVLIAYHLFYVVRIVLPRESDYTQITAFAVSLLDGLLYVHYISVVVIELRRLRPLYTITITRHPDGETHVISVGQQSLQDAAVDVLREYETRFSSFVPVFDRVRHGRRDDSGAAAAAASGFKLYDIDGQSGGESGAAGGGPFLSEESARAVLTAAARRKHFASAEMAQNDYKWEERLRKRRYRLMAAAEDAFSQFQAVGTNPRNSITKGKPIGQQHMDSRAAAQSVHAWLMRPLSKWVKMTKTQHRHPQDEVLAHVERCLALRLSPRTFLQRFLHDRQPPPSASSSSSSSAESSSFESKWSIVTDEPAASALYDGACFLLRCHNKNDDGSVQLLCQVTALPFFNLTEQPRNLATRFSLKVATEV